MAACALEGPPADTPLERCTACGAMVLGGQFVFFQHLPLSGLPSLSSNPPLSGHPLTLLLQRRFPKGLKVHVHSLDRFGCLAALARVLHQVLRQQTGAAWEGGTLTVQQCSCAATQQGPACLCSKQAHLATHAFSSRLLAPSLNHRTGGPKRDARQGANIRHLQVQRPHLLRHGRQGRPA